MARQLAREIRTVLVWIVGTLVLAGLIGALTH